jgi:hypothetical protein
MKSEIVQNLLEDNHKIRSGCYIRRPLDIGIKYQAALVPLRHIDYHL